MSDLTRYEKELAQELKKLPLPSEDAAWDDMSKLLDKDRDKIGGVPPGRGYIVLGSLLGALLIGSLIFFICKKTADNKKANNQTTISSGTKDNSVDNTNTLNNKETITTNDQSTTTDNNVGDLSKTANTNNTKSIPGNDQNNSAANKVNSVAEITNNTAAKNSQANTKERSISVSSNTNTQTTNTVDAKNSTGSNKQTLINSKEINSNTIPVGHNDANSEEASGKNLRDQHNDHRNNIPAKKASTRNTQNKTGETTASNEFVDNNETNNKNSITENSSHSSVTTTLAAKHSAAHHLTARSMSTTANSLATSNSDVMVNNTTHKSATLNTANSNNNSTSTTKTSPNNNGVTNNTVSTTNDVAVTNTPAANSNAVNTNNNSITNNTITKTPVANSDAASNTNLSSNDVATTNNISNNSTTTAKTSHSHIVRSNKKIALHSNNVTNNNSNSSTNDLASTTDLPNSNDAKTNSNEVKHTKPAYYAHSTAAVSTKSSKNNIKKKNNLTATKAKTQINISGPNTDEDATAVDSVQLIKIGQNVLAKRKAKHNIIKKDTSVVNPLAVTAKLADTTAKKKENKKHLDISAGIGEQQAIRLNCDCVYPNDAYTKSSLVTDYIPSVYIKIQPSKKWFIQAELKYKAPQYIQEQLYNKSISNLPLNYTTSTSVLKKVYYNQIPISFDYVIITHLSIGVGVIYNNFAGQVSQQDVIKKLYGTTADSTVSSSISTNKNDSDLVFTKNSFQGLIEGEYQWKRFTIGARYAVGLQSYLKYTDPTTGNPIEKKNNAVTFFIRFELWDNKKKK